MLAFTTFARDRAVFNAFQNAADLQQPKPLLQERIPADPRARHLLSKVLSRKALLPWRPFLDRAGRGQMAGLGALYWMLRWARPSRVCLTGCPLDEELLLIAAAVAESGGKRVQLESSAEEASEKLWQLIASAGLDWLVRIDDNASAQRYDCRVLANYAVARAFFESDPDIEPSRPSLLIGLSDESPVLSATCRALEQEMHSREFHVIFPPRPNERFWAAVHVEQRI